MPRLAEIFERDGVPEGRSDVHDYLVKTRGAVSNGFGPFLYSPELTSRIAHLGSYIRFESTLPSKMRELVALTTSSELGNPYERAIHIRDAPKEGASQAAVEAASNSTGLESLSEDEAFAIKCAREIVRDHKFSDSTFEAAHQLLGDKGVVELIGTIGYYAMLAFNHNAMQVRLPS